jgi:Uma2 family endonuclease
MTAPVSTPITAEEFLLMPESEGHELVDGELVEVGMGSESSWIGGYLFHQLMNFVLPRRIGRLFPQESGIQIWPDRPNLVRKPDTYFIRRERISGPNPTGWMRVAPDLVIEVVSPNDKASELEEKLREYREAAIPLIWVIYPATRTAHVLRANGSHDELDEQDALDGEDVIPGFSAPLADLFADPD